MKLLVFLHSLSAGGAERVAVNLSNHWAEKGWQIVIVTLAGQDGDFYTLHPSVCRITLGLAADSAHMAAAMWNNYRRIQALRSILKQVRPDVALAMMTRANILLALACRGLGIPAVGSERIHPPMFPLGRVWERFRRYAYGHLDAVIALTRESADWLKTHTRAIRVPVIPNPVPYPLPRHEPVVRPPAARDGCRHLLAVGRLVSQKGFKDLLAVFGALTARFPEWRLTILGEGPEREHLEALSGELGIGDRLLMPGTVGNVSDWYEAADLYVLSSRFEGFPNTLVEALAHGLAVVSVDCDTGPRDIVRHEVDGLLVPRDRPEALGQALEHLMADEDLRRRLAARAVEARARFSLERIAGQWEALFEALMN